MHSRSHDKGIIKEVGKSLKVPLIACFLSLQFNQPYNLGVSFFREVACSRHNLKRDKHLVSVSLKED